MNEPISASSIGLMAAAFRRRIRTLSAREMPPIFGSRWSVEMRAYIIATAAATIAHEVKAEGLLPAHFVGDMARWLARVAQDKTYVQRGWTSTTIDRMRWPCRICGKTALSRVGVYGYCHAHAQEGAEHDRIAKPGKAHRGAEVLRMMTIEKGTTNYTPEQRQREVQRRNRVGHVK